MFPSNEVLAQCFEFSAQAYSDLYKEINGFRPRGHDLSDYTAVELDALWISMCEELSEVMDREYEQQQRAIQDFEARLKKMMADFSISKGTAFRWMLQADDLEIVIERDDFGYACYEYGLPYSYENELKKILT